VGGLGKYATCHISQFLFFLSFFAFFCARPGRIAFLTDRHDLCAKTRVFGQGFAFWRSEQYPTTFRGIKKPQKTPKMGGNRHFAAKSAN